MNELESDISQNHQMMKNGMKQKYDAYTKTMIEEENEEDSDEDEKFNDSNSR